VFPVLGLQFFDVLQAFDGFFVEGAVAPLADQIVEGYVEGIGYFFAASMEVLESAKVHPVPVPEFKFIHMYPQLVSLPPAPPQC
jgi:hypothetical protein